MGQNRGFDAEPVIAHCHHCVCTGSKVGIPLGIGLLNNDIDCLDDDATALWQGVPRIHNQVENCRLELRTIHVAWVEPRIELQAQLDLRTGGMTHERFKFQQHAIEIEGYRPHHLAAREHQELFDQTLAALCGLEGRLGDTRNAVAVRGLSQNQFNVAGDNG